MQGGFYADGRAGVLALVLCAAVLTDWRTAWDLTDRRVVITSGLLVCWAGFNGAARGAWSDAVPASATVVGFTLMLLVARRLSPHERRTSVGGVLSIGLVVAVAGWSGVTLHRGPWAAPEGPFWRSMAATTYWNATAAILVMLGVLALTRCVGKPSDPVPAFTAAVLLAGAAATLSRGGALAAAAGIGCLIALCGTGALRAVLPPIIGASLILLGLVPALPVSSAPNPAAALLAAAVGLATTVLLARRMSVASPRRVLLVVVTGFVVLGSVALAPLAPRLSLASPRWGTWQAALGEVADHPLAGVGPGRLVLVWRDDAGVTHGTALAHNEWLQLLAELGAVGALLVLVMGVAVAGPLIRGLRGSEPLVARAGLAVATSFLVASTFDFLWHLIAVPVLAALILGIASPSTAGRSSSLGTSPGVIPVPEPESATARPTGRSQQ